MKSVLIVSPHFPPINAADHQRVRMAIPFLEGMGWRPTVLAVDPQFVEAPRDEWLLKTLPPELEVVRVRALPVALTKRIGMSTLAFRCRRFLRESGDELLCGRKFDLVYFSTTQMGVHRLGLRWKRRFGVPFALDLQDPWVNDYYRRHPEVTPPGGRVKYAVSQFAARVDEPRCLAAASAVTAVSGRYIDDIADRMPEVDRGKFHVIPFGAAERDFETAVRHPVSQSHIDFSDGLEHWVAVGRGGDDMRPALVELFRAFATLLTMNPARFERVRMHFLGTDYAAGDRARKTVAPVAEEIGVGQYVSEQPHRIPYSEALACLVKASLLLVIGSNDPGYNPSKVAPYLMSGRPVLAILHSASPAAAVVEQAGGACHRLTNAGATDSDSLAALLDRPLTSPVRRDGALMDLTAEAMTRRLVDVFASIGMD
jgi:hypothetical protein